MNLSRRKTVGVVLTGAAVAASGFFTVKRYLSYKNLKAELSSIPWDLSKEDSSWKLFFNTKSDK